jgi:hypothetical protein
MAQKKKNQSKKGKRGPAAASHSTRAAENIREVLQDMSDSEIADDVFSSWHAHMTVALDSAIAEAPKTSLRDFQILLDSGANISIVRNVSLLRDYVCCESNADITGTINADQPTIFQGYGNVHVGEVTVKAFYNPNAQANVLCLRAFKLAARDVGITVRDANQEEEAHDTEIGLVFVDAENRRLGYAKWVNDLLIYDATAEYKVFLTAYGASISEEKMALVFQARELQARLGFIPGDALAKLIQNGALKSGVKPSAARSARSVLGPGVIESKAKNARVKISRRVGPPPGGTTIITERDQKLYADCFTIGDKVFVIAVSEPMHLVLAEVLNHGKSHTGKDIVDALMYMVGRYQSQSCNITEVHFDGEARHGDLANIPGLILHPPGQHVGIAERAIRTLKNLIRALILNAPHFNGIWAGNLLTEVVKCAVALLSVRYTRATTSLFTPFQQFLGFTPDAEKDFKAYFGQHILVENLADRETKLSDVTRERMSDAIWLRPAFDEHFSSWVLIVKTLKVVTRTHIQLVHEGFPQWIFDSVKKWAGCRLFEVKVVQWIVKGKQTDIMVIEPQPEEDDVIEHWSSARPRFPSTRTMNTKNALPVGNGSIVGESLPVQVAESLSVQTAESLPGQVAESLPVQVAESLSVQTAESLSVQVATDSGVGMVTSGNHDPVTVEEGVADPQVPTAQVNVGGVPSGVSSENVEEAVTTVVEEHHSKRPNNQSDLVADLRGADIDDDMHTLGTEGEESGLILNVVDDSVLRRGSRTRKVSYRMHRTSTGAVEERVTYTIAKSVKDVMRLDHRLKLDAMEAIREEIRNLTVDHLALVAVDKRDVKYSKDEVIPSSLFIDKKYTNGVYDKMKARLVAGGHRQNREDFVDQVSSTVHTESVFIVLSLAAKES